MDAVKLRRLLGAGDEGAEVDEGGAGLGHGGDPNLAKEVDAVGRGGDADGDEVAGAEAGELMVAQVVLDLESVDWARVDALRLEAKGRVLPRRRSTLPRALSSAVSGQAVSWLGTLGLGRRTLVVVAQVDEATLELWEEVGEGVDGLLLGGMGRSQVDGVCGGLWHSARVVAAARGHPIPCCLGSGRGDSGRVVAGLQKAPGREDGGICTWGSG